MSNVLTHMGMIMEARSWKLEAGSSKRDPCHHEFRAPAKVRWPQCGNDISVHCSLFFVFVWSVSLRLCVVSVLDAPGGINAIFRL